MGLVNSPWELLVYKLRGTGLRQTARVAYLDLSEELFYRISKLGGGRMPHMGSQIVDEPGTHLIHDWIRQLPPRREDVALIDKLRSLDEPALEKHLSERSEELLELVAHAVAKANGRTTITPEDRQKAEREIAARAATQAKSRAAERTAAINQLLSSTSSALRLERALGDDHLPRAIRKELLAAAMARPESQIRDLFERFVPEQERPKRLGSVIKPEQILALKGDAQRGRQLFFKSTVLQCVNCHRIAGTGSKLGPDLTEMGKKYSRAQILESILEPSKFIDPKYIAYFVETTDGQVQTGLLAEKNDKEVVLRNAGDKEFRIPAKKVATLAPQSKSLMPELLLRDLTAEQAADLLEFLAGLK